MNLPFMQNPLSILVKKQMSQILGSKTSSHADVIERLSHYLVTKNDIEQFISLVSEIYGAGYMKSVNEHKEYLQGLGYKVTVRSSDNQPETSSIFPEDQSEKSG